MLTRRKTTLGLALAAGLALAVAGCSGQSGSAGSGDEATADATVSAETTALPAGTPVVVALNAPTRSDDLAAGSMLYGQLAEGIVVEGQAVMQAGAPVTLEVVRAEVAHDGQPARLVLALKSVNDQASGPAEVATRPLVIVGDTAPADEPAAGEANHEAIAAPGGILGTPQGEIVALQIDGDVVELPAGQRLLFVTAAPGA